MKDRSARAGAGGFTLIEVIGALLIFSVGVLMIVNLTGVLSVQMQTAAVRSAVASVLQERLDSLQSVPYDSLSVGTWTDTVTLQGRPYRCVQVVLQTSPLVREAQVTVEPLEGSGPGQTASTFVLRPWH